MQPCSMRIQPPGGTEALAAWHALLQQDTDSQLAALDIIPDLQRLDTDEWHSLKAAYTGTFNKLLESDTASVTLRTLHGMRTWRGELPEGYGKHWPRHWTAGTPACGRRQQPVCISSPRQNATPWCCRPSVTATSGSEMQP